MTEITKKYLVDIILSIELIDDAIVWAIKHNHLPKLKTEVEALLK